MIINFHVYEDPRVVELYLLFDRTLFVDVFYDFEDSCEWRWSWHNKQWWIDEEYDS